MLLRTANFGRFNNRPTGPHGENYTVRAMLLFSVLFCSTSCWKYVPDIGTYKLGQEPASGTPSEEYRYCADIELAAKSQSSWYLAGGVTAAIVGGAAAASIPVVTSQVKEPTIPVAALTASAATLGFLSSLSFGAFAGSNEAATNVAALGPVAAAASAGDKDSRAVALEECSKVKSKWIGSRNDVAQIAQKEADRLKKEADDKRTSDSLAAEDAAVIQWIKASQQLRTDFAIAAVGAARELARRKLTDLEPSWHQQKRRTSNADNVVLLETEMALVREAIKTP